MKNRALKILLAIPITICLAISLIIGGVLIPVSYIVYGNTSHIVLAMIRWILEKSEPYNIYL